jgi:hypothetical protein
MKQKHILVFASIAIMWLAVLFIGVFGGDYILDDGYTRIEIPIVAVLAVCATIASAIIGVKGFKD